MRRNVLHKSVEKISLTQNIEIRDRLYDDLFESTNDIVFLLDPSTTIIRINNRIQDIGYRASELIGESFTNIIPEAHKERAYQAITERREKARDTNFQSLKPKVQSRKIPLILNSHRRNDIQTMDYELKAMRVHNGPPIRENHVYTMCVANPISLMVNNDDEPDNKIRIDPRLILEFMESDINMNIVTKNHRILFQTKKMMEVFGARAKVPCFQYYMNRDSPCDNCDITQTLQSNKARITEKIARNNQTASMADFNFILSNGFVRKPYDPVNRD